MPYVALFANLFICKFIVDIICGEQSERNITFYQYVMKKNLFLTSLLVLVATLGMAQKASWPITLTTADGLPGKQIVKNYSYKSQVFELDEAVSTLRFTAISTNTVDAWVEQTYDGYGTGWGPGFPFIALGELAIYDGNGQKVNYTATCNAVAEGDGGGVAALNDGKPSTFLHTSYYKGEWPQAYHYVEVALDQPVDAFSFSWYSRDNYFKNLITYLGITPGTEYFPYPEQEFKLGEQVATLDELAEEGALFVLRGNAEDFNHVSDDVVNRWYKGDVFYHSSYGAAVTPSAASLVYLIPDPAVENGYKVCWLNSGNYLINPELNGDIGSYYYCTKNEFNAGTIQFVAVTDSMTGTFKMFAGDGKYVIQQNPRSRMDIVNYVDTVDGNYYWTIYKASVKGSAIAGELQEEIDDAERRIAEVGGKVEGYDDGEYDALTAVLTEAKAIVSKEGVKASEIITTKKSLNLLKAAYAAVGIWSHIDSIGYITAAVENGDIVVSGAPGWVEGSYSQAALANLVATSDAAMQVVGTYQSLADIDAAISSIYAAIDAFWASKITNVNSLPFRVGTAEDGLPGVKTNSIYRWESPQYFLDEDVKALRFTVFKTHISRLCVDKPFVCINEIEFYDFDGNKIPLTADSYKANSIAAEGMGLAGLCDGDYKLNNGTHFHSRWSTNSTYDASDYFYLEVTFPEAINSFKYVQYCRGNGYDDVPVDFVFGKAGITYTPEDVDFTDPYNTKAGTIITDASQITDDGIYVLEGLLNCAPEGSGSGSAKYYTSNAVYGNKIGAPCAFSIRKTGAADGSFYIQSLSDCSYWSQTIDDDGWGANSTTMKQAEAGKFIIAPANRAEYGKKEFANTFVIYMYNDTVVRDGVSRPYIIAQDWESKIGYFSVDALANNDWDGEGEWRIYKMTMDDPYIYWAKNAVATINAMNLKPGIDPGFYPEKVPGAFAAAMTAAQSAIAADDNNAAKAAVFSLGAALDGIDLANANPMVPGIYVIETANANFFANQGVSKVICTYLNDFETNSPLCVSEYSLYWSNMPEDIDNASAAYKFQFISASESERVQGWLSAGKISAEEAANAYYIRSCEVGQYACAHDGQMYSQDVGLRAEQDQPYIVRSRGNGVFDLWNPAGGNSGYSSMHMEGNSGGSGNNGDIVYWSGNDASSQWYLRKSIMELGVSIEVLNGTGSVSTEKVEYGSAVSVQIAPKNGDYKLKCFTVNGVDVTDKLVDNKYTVYDVTEDVKFMAEYFVTSGDANDDGIITISDVVAVVNALLEMVQDGFNNTAADINGDGEISIGDIVAIVKMVLSPEADAAGVNAKRGMIVAGNGSLAIENVTSNTGVAAVPVALNNQVAYTAFQMDVELPEGMEFRSAVLGSRAAGHTAAWSKLPDGKVRVLAYSLNNATFAGNAGELVTFNVAADEAVAGSISVDNVRAVTTEGVEVAINGCGSVIDINGTTGIGTVDGDELKVYTASGALVVESAKAMQIAVYSLNGRLVETLNVAAGKNVYDTLPAGTYVVGNSKVIIK